MRFRLDPRAPAPPPPPALAPAAPAPAPAGAPAEGAPRRRRWLLAGGLALVLLLGGAGGTLYAMEAGPFAYPHRYLLQGRDLPAGLEVAPLRAEYAESLGLQENPGRIDDAVLRDEFSDRDDGVEPEEGWAQVLESPDRDEVVVILALRHPDEDAARSAAQEARPLCSFGSGTVLRDGDVVVFLVSQGDGASGPVRDVAAALVAKTPQLSRVCGVS